MFGGEERDLLAFLACFLVHWPILGKIDKYFIFSYEPEFLSMIMNE